MSAVGDLAVLAYASTQGGSYTAFANIEDIEHFKVTVDEIKTTKLSDTSVQTQPGMPDYGEITCKLRFAASLVPTINGWITGRSLMWFKVTVNDSASISTGSNDVIQGWVKNYDKLGTLKNNEEILANIVIRCTGAATFTAGS